MQVLTKYSHQFANCLHLQENNYTQSDRHATSAKVTGNDELVTLDTLMISICHHKMKYTRENESLGKALA